MDSRTTPLKEPWLRRFQMSEITVQDKQMRLVELAALWMKVDTAKFVVQANIITEVYNDKLWEGRYKTFAECMSTLFNVGLKHAQDKMRYVAAAKNIGLITDVNAGEMTPVNYGEMTRIDISDEQLFKPLTKYNDQPDFQRQIWDRVEAESGNGITRELVADCVKTAEEQRDMMLNKFYMVEEWNQLTGEEKAEAVSYHNPKTRFNKQSNNSIEWALWSWNPVTGCLHDCPYCYARDIANRFYEHLPLEERFAPIFYPGRLAAPANTKQDLTKESNPIRRMGLRNVFVCSMSDLFGKWVPDEWIEAVLKQVADNPQWNFLFLTKFPIRMAEFTYPPNTWLGTTVDEQWRVERAEKAFIKIKESGYKGVCWLSCEPMLERLTFSSLEMFDWLVIGGSSESTQTEEFYPPREWFLNLEAEADALGVQVYEKSNLQTRRKEYPK